MFIGRERELTTLNRMFKSEIFEFAVIYGRRRIGKTALINEFIKDKDAIYFTGVESNESQNLENLSRSILEYSTGIAANTRFSSFQSALEYIFELSKSKRIVLVIDEYPYVARASKSLASTLQYLIDHNKDKSKLFLILCGSLMSYMEDHVLAYKSPLYGRRTAQLKIEPFDFFEACTFFKSYSNEDKALAYGIIGGTPQYLALFDDKHSIEQSIKYLFLDQSSILFEEPSNLLKQEVREPAIYNAIIASIATGCSKLNEIASRIEEETSVCSIYIKNLINLGIIKKETPYGDSSRRKTIYSIEDNMFRFWYRFVQNNMSLISRGATDLVFNRIKPCLSTYMGPIFEQICTQYLWKLLLKGDSPIAFNALGRWWGPNPKTKSQEEIDIMGTDHDSALFAECKWINELVDSEILETLLNRGNLFSYKHKYFYLFSKRGFTKSCIAQAKEHSSVTLVKLDEMF